MVVWLPEDHAESASQYHGKEACSAHSSQERVHTPRDVSVGPSIPPWLGQVVVVEEEGEAPAPVGGGDELHDNLHHLLARAEYQLAAWGPVGPAEPGGEGDEVRYVEDVVGAGVQHQLRCLGARGGGV